VTSGKALSFSTLKKVLLLVNTYQLTEARRKALFAIDLIDLKESGKFHDSTFRGPYLIEVSGIYFGLRVAPQAGRHPAPAKRDLGGAQGGRAGVPDARRPRAQHVQGHPADARERRTRKHPRSRMISEP
jgi:hypothetical protein